MITAGEKGLGGITNKYGKSSRDNRDRSRDNSVR
jgi:hypothetical protein